MNRRTMLKVAPAVMVAPAALAAAPESELMAKIQGCVDMHRWLNSGDAALPKGAEYDAAVLRLCDLEAEALAISATTVEEFAAKVYVWTDYGQEGASHDTANALIHAEVRRLTGIGRV